jgi:hypothetical protein
MVGKDPMMANGTGKVRSKPREHTPAKEREKGREK